MSTESVAASYRGLFAEPVLRRLAVADACARLPQGMVSITLLLVAAQHASMAVAGLVVAGYTLGQAVTGPARGRRAPPPGRPPERPARRGPMFRSPVLRLRGLGRLLVTAALVNAALSATEVALTGYVRHHHALWASGPLLAEVSIGSILGSLLLGARTPPGRLPWLLVGYAGGLVLLTAAALAPPLLAVAAPLAGLCLGPVLAALFGQAASAAPHGGGTETQAWLNSIMNGGAAGGAALAGAVLAGPGAGRPVLALGAAAAAAAGAGIAGRARPRGHAPGLFGKKKDGGAEPMATAPGPEGR